MRVRLQYFSALRELGAPGELDVREGATIGEMLEQLFARVPGLRGWDRHLLIAVAEEYASRSDTLEPDDLVSLMPPVQGG